MTTKADDEDTDDDDENDEIRTETTKMTKTQTMTTQTKMTTTTVAAGVATMDHGIFLQPEFVMQCEVKSSSTGIPHPIGDANPQGSLPRSPSLLLLALPPLLAFGF